MFSNKLAALLLLSASAFAGAQVGGSINSPAAGGGGSAFPLTVSGTVNSGGIPCFTSTTVEASSGVLNINILPKGGGAGVCPTNSSITDDGTSVTTTDTGGFVAPVFVFNGTTATFIAFSQGSTSAGLAPCSNANTACFQAPAAVTAYKANVPGAAPVNNFSAWTFSNASPSVGSFNKMQQAAFLTTTYTNATTGMTSLTGLSFAVEASTNYTMICNMAYHSSVLTDDLSVQITGPASPTAVTITYITEVSSTGVSDGVATAFSTPITATGSPVALTNYPFTVAMTLINGANAGTVQVQAASSATGTITILPGSCQLQ